VHGAVQQQAWNNMKKKNIKKINTYAKDLEEPKYRQRVVSSKKKYKRNRREDHE
jgi:hypothetical protein